MAKFVDEYLPFIATENLLMEAVKRGADRQATHEIIREASMEATARMKNGENANLIAALASHPEFGMTEEEIRAVMKPQAYIGRCPEQVDRFVKVCRSKLNVPARAAEDINV